MTVRLTAMNGGSITVRAEVAATPSHRARGLMGRPSVPAGTGMLFLYPAAREWGGYWMKDTLVPLDIAFIREGRVVYVDTMQPCRVDPCPLYDPRQAYDAALEVAAGTFGRADAGVGASVEVSGPTPRAET